MLHVIYIYFIINAFIVGFGFKTSNDWRVHILFLLFGVPIIVVGLSYSFTVDVIWKKCLRPLYLVIFTDRFANMSEYTIEIKTKQYRGTLTQGNFNTYNRFLARLIDKKYNYGITKENNYEKRP